MKLLNQSLKYLSVFMLLIVSFWAVVFYVNTLDEIRESIDEGLENSKRIIIKRADSDSTMLNKYDFDESNYTISEISSALALTARNRYIDTMIYMQDDDDEEPEPEPVRMLTTVFERDGHYYELKIINSMVEEDDLVKDLLWSVLWLYLILVVSIVIINNLVLRRLWKPFYSLLDQLKRYKLGSSKELPQIDTNTKEFKDLLQTVNALLQRSLETYDQQKQFIGNASHELQTPLAIATNKLELLLEKGDLQETQATQITQVMQIIERLVRLNKSLLLLARIENNQFFDNKTVSINEAVKQTVDLLEDFAAFRNIQFDMSKTATLQVEMDAELVHIILLNLLKNAISHNIQNGFVRIHISPGSLKISNTGSAVALDADKIFNRFYKSETDPTGTGLGLAIAKAICNLYGFDLRYTFEEQQHTFTVRFHH